LRWCGCPPPRANAYDTRVHTHISMFAAGAGAGGMGDFVLCDYDYHTWLTKKI